MKTWSTSLWVGGLSVPASSLHPKLCFLFSPELLRLPSLWTGRSHRGNTHSDSVSLMWYPRFSPFKTPRFTNGEELGTKKYTPQYLFTRQVLFTRSCFLESHVSVSIRPCPLEAPVLVPLIWQWWKTGRVFMGSVCSQPHSLLTSVTREHISPGECVLVGVWCA